jgi:uncharacterized repeat protein (TIGR03803 family)
MTKDHVKNRTILPVLIIGLGMILGSRVPAQTFTNLYSFTGGTDGAEPYAALILSGNTLYGTAQLGGSSFNGTVFKANLNGTGFTELHTFTATLDPDYTNSDGAYPEAGLILSGNTLYGTANSGGSSGNGTVFAINPDGTGFTNLHNFSGPPSNGSPITNSDGANPSAGLILSGSTLYGTTSQGGSSGNGTVFAINTNGTGFTNLHSFNSSEGANPQASLVASGNSLYGTASRGGSSGFGTVFALNTDGTGFTNLHNLSYGDGVNPQAALILSGDTLYGTAMSGGSSNFGTVFALTTNGTGFTNLHSFTYYSDGANPQASLALIGSTLYGTANSGGSSSVGTVFAINIDGTGFTNRHNFVFGSDGSNPDAGLILSGDSLYGTAYNGGGFGNGTLFSLSLGSVSTPTPTLTIVRSGASVILTWPTNAAGLTLQSTTNLVSPAVWITNSAGPAVVNGQNVLTNPASGSKKFYRLSQP